MSNKINNLTVSGVILLVSFTCILTAGIANLSLLREIATKSTELSRVLRGTEDDKARFANSNFCSDGTLDQLALEAQDELEAVVMLNDLGRQCVVALELIKS